MESPGARNRARARVSQAAQITTAQPGHLRGPRGVSSLGKDETLPDGRTCAARRRLRCGHAGHHRQSHPARY